MSHDRSWRQFKKHWKNVLNDGNIIIFLESSRVCCRSVMMLNPAKISHPSLKNKLEKLPRSQALAVAGTSSHEMKKNPDLICIILVKISKLGVILRVQVLYAWCADSRVVYKFYSNKRVHVIEKLQVDTISPSPPTPPTSVSLVTAGKRSLF